MYETIRVKLPEEASTIALALRHDELLGTRKALTATQKAIAEALGPPSLQGQIDALRGDLERHKKEYDQHLLHDASDHVRYDKAARTSEVLHPQPRQWQKWDVAKDHGGIFLRIAGQTSMHNEKCWENLSGQFTFRSDNELPADTFLFNLADMLAKGGIPVVLTEEEVKAATVCHQCATDTSLMDSLVAKAHAAYRQAKGPAPLERSTP